MQRFLYTINPTHRFFKDPTEDIKREVPEQYYFNFAIKLNFIYIYLNIIFFNRLANHFDIIKAYSKRKGRGLCTMTEEEKE